MRAAVLHYRADLPGHELIIAITKFLGLRALTGSNAQHQIEMIAELGAAFLSNEAGILDSVRFENSAA